jgi:hypothetical protein
MKAPDFELVEEYQYGAKKYANIELGEDLRGCKK